MSSLKAIYIAAATALFLLISIASFNYAIDPMCYYRCDQVEAGRATSNSYYQAAQKILAHPEVEQILLGSSRAGTTSPIWLYNKTGIKTLNLEVPGAELMAKLALLNLAIENNKIKRVIWYADYFEIITENIDEKLKGSAALKNLLPAEAALMKSLEPASPLVTLIDQNTIAASVNTLKVNASDLAKQLGGNSGEYSACDAENYLGKESAESLAKKVGLLFENYSQRILKPEPSKQAWDIFASSVKSLESRGIEMVVVIIPYHPDFIARLKKEFPSIYDRHQAWVTNVNAIATEKIKVLDYSAGIPSGDASPKYWNDGVHFTCNGVIKMLDAVL